MTFFSRALTTAAVMAVCAMSLPQTASARDSDRDRDRGRGSSSSHDRDHGRGHDHDRDHGRSRSRMLNISVQRALAARGYYSGRADGDIGYGTRRAIMRFQVSRRMRPTGLVDSALLRALRIG